MSGFYFVRDDWITGIYAATFTALMDRIFIFGNVRHAKAALRD